MSVDESQFPGRVTQEIHASLERRELNHKFLYDSVKQAEKWLSIHEAFSPARTDPDCVATYDRAFRDVAGRWKSPAVSVVGLGCGGGHKEVRLVELLTATKVSSSFVAADVSLPLVLAARQRFAEASRRNRYWGVCEGWVLDLSTAVDLRRSLGQFCPASLPRLITFFGMMPNFEPTEVLPKLASVLRRQDRLLLSANLAPGDDYNAGVLQVLPLYDNAETRDWIESAFWSLGFTPQDGSLHFEIRSAPTNPRLKRIQADFKFSSARSLRVQGCEYRFQRGQQFRLFYSYRYSQELLSQTLAEHGLTLDQSWVTPSGAEGVFLVKRL